MGSAINPAQGLLLPSKKIVLPAYQRGGENALSFDRPLAVRINWFLSLAWENGWSSFTRHVSPEVKYRPDSIQPGSREDALWLFWGGWLNRSGTTANILFRKARDLYNTTPFLFDPLDPRSYDPEPFLVLRDVIPHAVHENHKERVWWWQRDCMGLLRQKYAGDPRNIFLTARLTNNWFCDRNAVINRLCEFKGVKQKIAQLILGWFQEANWPEDQAMWETMRKIPAIAVDIWLMRLVFQVGIITSWKSDLDKIVGPQISDFFCEICATEGISHTSLIQGWWHTGARTCSGMRRLKPAARRQYCYDHCPLYSVCKGVVPANYHYDDDGYLHHLGNSMWDKMEPHPVDVHVTPRLLNGGPPHCVAHDLSFVPLGTIRRSQRRPK